MREQDFLQRAREVGLDIARNTHSRIVPPPKSFRESIDSVVDHLAATKNRLYASSLVAGAAGYCAAYYLGAPKVGSAAVGLIAFAATAGKLYNHN